MINKMDMGSLIQPGLFIKMVVAEWDKQNNNFNKFLSSVTDEQLSKEIAPGKNTGIYLVGHLLAISDAMLPLLAFGDKSFPNKFGPPRRKTGSKDIWQYRMKTSQRSLTGIS
jgi:hypothetical protein